MAALVDRGKPRTSIAAEVSNADLGPFPKVAVRILSDRDPIRNDECGSLIMQAPITKVPQTTEAAALHVIKP